MNNLNKTIPGVLFEKRCNEIRGAGSFPEMFEELQFFICKDICKHMENHRNAPDYDGEADKLIDEFCNYCPIMKILLP